MNTISIKKVRYNSEEIKNIYYDSFTKEERMPFLLMVIMSFLWNTEFLGFYDEEIPVGFTYLGKNSKLVFIMFFAVDRNLRSKGYGSQILDIIKKRYPDKQIIVSILPCDKPCDDLELRKKRKEFYQRCGFSETWWYITINNIREEILTSDGKFSKRKFQAFMAFYSNFTMWPKIQREKE